MKNIIFTVIVILAVPSISVCQGTDVVPTAIINDQVGQALFREKKELKEVTLTRNKDLAKELYPDQEIRCGKGCKLELLLCTGKKVAVAEKDGWYRIPVLTCERDRFIPGFKSSLQSGGRSASYRPDTRGGTRRRSTGARVGGAAAIGNVFGAISGERGASIGAAIGAGAYYSSSAIPNYYDRWFFEFPYEGVVVAPELFVFEIVDNAGTTSATSGRIRLVISMSASDSENLSSTLRQLNEDIYFDNGILLKGNGESFNTDEIKSFLKEVRKVFDPAHARIYCTITVSGVPETITKELKPHTLGFEFYVMSTADEQTVLKNLEDATKETGIVRYLGRADVYESLGLLNLSRNELLKALELSPENDEIRWRLRRLRRY